MAVDVNRYLKPLVKSEILSDVYSLLGLADVEVTAWQPTEPIPQILDKTIGWLVDDVWNPYVTPALRAISIETASGGWLSLLAALRYNRPRKEKSAATGPIVVVNTGAFFGTIAAGAMRIKHGTSNKTYHNTTAITLTAYPDPGATVTATFEADEPGTASNALAGTISTTPSAAPVGVSVQTNASALLGQDEETDASLRARCRAAQAEATGIRCDYEAVALDPVGALERNGLPVPASWQGVNPAINRVRVVSLGGASVAVYCASKSGAAGGDSTTPDTDVFKANVAVQLLSKKAGITAATYAASNKTITCGTITLYIDRSAPGVTVAEAEAWGAASLDRFFETHPIGGRRKTGGGQGYVFADEVRDAAKGRLEVDAQGVERRVPIPGILTADCSLVDTTLAVNEVAVPTYTLVAVLVTQ
jgi:hypothetical protein